MADNLHRRTYGYKPGLQQERQEKIHGEVKSSKERPWWARLLLFLLVLPFLLAGYILKFIWWILKKPQVRGKLGWWALTLIIIGFLGGIIMVVWASRDLPDPDKLTDRKVAQSTKIYDRTGEHLLYEIYTDQKRTLVDLSDIPKDLVNGVIATEDSQFYQHKGVRFSSFLRAVYYGLSKGQRLGGTSTLTQQLVKNAILTNERSLTRKIKEIILSLRLEQKYSKDQILKIYFNEIPYGSTNYGVEAAAQSYFGKHVKDLNLQECATLAGLPQAPSTYLNNPQALKQRRNFVLGRMFAEGYISEEQKNKAQAEPLTLEKHYGDMQAPHFVLYVKDKLIEMFGEQMVDTGGLKVITTLDWDKQQAAEKAVTGVSSTLKQSNANNASLVALDPKNAQILAMVGSLDFNNNEIDGQFNVATLGKRQPGSSFKPIVYAAAFEKGYTPDTILWDVNTNFSLDPSKPYEPRDYDLKERGPVTVRQALQGSLNIPAVEALYLVGQDKGIEFAERLGYTTLSQGEFGLSLVLGGGEVKLLDHVAAYSVFANNGLKNEPASILQVSSVNGDELFKWKDNGGEIVLDEKITAEISNVLSDDAARAYVFGAGSVLTLPDRSVAVKTGTTNNYVDAWTVGYTPSLVAGVWVGNTDNHPMKKGDGGSKLAAPIWHNFMVEALQNMPAENFPELPPNDAGKPILRGSTGGGITLKINSLNGLIATSSTPPGIIVERTYVPAHSILHYVNKDDPRGPAPTDPAQDPQYNIWESAIVDWVKRNQTANPNWSLSFADPPTLYDNAQNVGLLPSLEIMSPAENSVLNSRDLEVEVRATSPRGVAKVTYKIDNRTVGVIKNSPFALNYHAYDLENGVHQLTVVAEDDIGNQTVKQLSFTLQAPEDFPAVYFEDKQINLQASQFPHTFSLAYYKLAQISQVNVYKETGGNKTLLQTITDFSSLFDNKILFKWNEAPTAGSYQLIVEVKLKDGSVREGGRTTVTVQS